MRIPDPAYTAQIPARRPGRLPAAARLLFAFAAVAAMALVLWLSLASNIQPPCFAPPSGITAGQQSNPLSSPAMARRLVC
jgi:hypothetical protein